MRMTASTVAMIRMRADYYLDQRQKENPTRILECANLLALWYSGGEWGFRFSAKSINNQRSRRCCSLPQHPSLRVVVSSTLDRGCPAAKPVRGNTDRRNVETSALHHSDCGSYHACVE